MPRKSSANQKTAFLQIRAMPDEVEKWRSQAAAAGLSMSEFVRLVLDGQQISPRQNVKLDPAFIRQLAMFGNNLNQIVRWINRTGGRGVSVVEVAAGLVQIERQLEELKLVVLDHVVDAD